MADEEPKNRVSDEDYTETKQIHFHLDETKSQNETQFSNEAYEKTDDEYEDPIVDNQSKIPVVELTSYSATSIELDLNDSLDEVKVNEHIEFKCETEQVVIQQVETKIEITKSEDDQHVHFFTRIVILRTNLIDIFKKPISRKIIIDVAIGTYILYFIASMILSNPLYFVRKIDSTSNIIDDYIFKNNKGLGFLVLNLIFLSFFIWEHCLSKRFRRPKDSQTLNIKYKENAILGLKLLIFSILLIFFIFNINSIYNVISLIGLFTFIFICVITSKSPLHINQNILINGLLLQSTLALLVIRNEFGYKFFKFLSDKVVEFLNFTDAGSTLVFGQNFRDHYFAFKACAVVIFFGAMVNFFYYIGLLQFVILRLSLVINKLMGTSPTESVSATANIFVGQTEAPLVILPFLNKMTKSELFAVMVGGFSTASGSVLAAYMGFGVSINHIIVASLLGAPGSLIVAKTLYPETEETCADFEMIKNMEKEDIYNFLEAITKGAMGVLKAVGAIIANLIACTSFFAFVDKLVAWFFSMLTLENFGLTAIFQYLFYPFVMLMGVNIEDCRVVSKLIGIKIFVNEFVAYSHMGEMIKSKNDLIQNGLYNSYLNGSYTLPSGTDIIINNRSVAIATYALCGFANLASIGMQIACFSTYSPLRARFFPKIGFYAMIGGCICNFMNACIAGMWYRDF